jgi:hypothetical protein
MKNRNLIMWVVRILNFVAFVLILSAICEDGFPPKSPFSYPLLFSIAQTAFFASAAALLIAFRWNVIGGVVSIACLTITFVFVLISKQIVVWPVFLCMIPGIIYLSLSRKKEANA